MVSTLTETSSYGDWQEPVLAIFKWFQRTKFKVVLVMVMVMVMVMVVVLVMVMVLVVGMAMIMVGDWQEPVLAIL